MNAEFVVAGMGAWFPHPSRIGRAKNGAPEFGGSEAALNSRFFAYHPRAEERSGPRALRMTPLREGIACSSSLIGTACGRRSLIACEAVGIEPKACCGWVECLVSPPFAHRTREEWGTRDRWLKGCVEQQILRLPPPS